MATTPDAATDSVADLSPLADVLAQDAGISGVVAAMRAGSGAAIDGVWGSSTSLTAAALARQAPGPVVVVLPHMDDLVESADEVALFLGRPTLVLPGWDVPPERTTMLDQVFATRLRVLKQLTDKDHGPPPVVVTSINCLMQPVPSAPAILNATRALRVGDDLDIEAFVTWLVDRGLRNMPAVELHGEFSRRGGILDLFSPDQAEPVRIELFGDQIESIRAFDVETQRSTDRLDELAITILPEDLESESPLADHLPSDAWCVLVEPAELDDAGRRWLGKLARRRGLYTVESTLKRLLERPTATLSQLPGAAFETTAHLQTESVERYQGAIHQLESLLEPSASDEPVYIVCGTDTERDRLDFELERFEEPLRSRLHRPIGRLRAGFRLLKPKALLLSASELLGRRQAPRPRGRVSLGRAIDSFLELREGDYVVHVSHGIARYAGMRMVTRGQHREEHLELEFHGGTRVYVPATKIDLVQKYVGGTRDAPPLSRIGGKMWARRKEQAEEAVADLASQMLDLQAQRQALKGIPFEADSLWQQQFEERFPYNETPDQLTALAAIKHDMESRRPMDRLICGEVGFGKTELAMRAAFKAVDSGFQVGVLVPTTILAEQHYRTFVERMEGFPFEIGVLSRFRTKGQQRELLNRLAEGSVDIVIGTHRLVQPDVKFANLGLVIIDEEQRFGVEHKEKLKILRRLVDVMTLTATPIPRTLHLSLLGLRDISSLETPPADRLAVETRVTRWDDTLVEYAIRRELGRGGQVFFVHNRIGDLKSVANKILRLVPEARIVTAHGQMEEDELNKAMLGFVNHECDILVATTIVESGLDVPRANTMFVDDADRYGLAELHQLRGRVGRYKHRAYCYMLVDPDRPLTGDAARRLKAIEEFSSLGAGFGIAMRDLEIRGAGNLLGTEQSGHIAAVGYEMYCQLLEKAVRHINDDPAPDRVEVELDLTGEAYLPETYVPDMRMKIDLYRRLSRVSTIAEVDTLETEMRDRFGRMPQVVRRMTRLARIRIWAHHWQLARIHIDGPHAVMAYRNGNRIAELVLHTRGRVKIVDPKTAYYKLGAAAASPESVLERLESLLRPKPDGD
jgi:transcription-repair coupling factor (superfamily II helicase)